MKIKNQKLELWLFLINKSGQVLINKSTLFAPISWIGSEDQVSQVQEPQLRIPAAGESTASNYCKCQETWEYFTQTKIKSPSQIFTQSELEKSESICWISKKNGKAGTKILSRKIID